MLFNNVIWDSVINGRTTAYFRQVSKPRHLFSSYQFFLYTVNESRKSIDCLYSQLDWTRTETNHNYFYKKKIALVRFYICILLIKIYFLVFRKIRLHLPKHLLDIKGGHSSIFVHIPNFNNSRTFLWKYNLTFDNGKVINRCYRGVSEIEITSGVRES